MGLCPTCFPCGGVTGVCSPPSHTWQTPAALSPRVTLPLPGSHPPSSQPLHGHSGTWILSFRRQRERRAGVTSASSAQRLPCCVEPPQPHTDPQPAGAPAVIPTLSHTPAHTLWGTLPAHPHSSPWPAGRLLSSGASLRSPAPHSSTPWASCFRGHRPYPSLRQEAGVQGTLASG